MPDSVLHVMKTSPSRSAGTPGSADISAVLSPRPTRPPSQQVTGSGLPFSASLPAAAAALSGAA
eukprot:353972-Chlamydomonas_euryale.AAC.13